MISGEVMTLYMKRYQLETAEITGTAGRMKPTKS